MAMEVKEGKEKKQSLIVKTWERCKSIGSPKSPEETGERQWRRWRRAAEGYFTVYVGPQRERFVVRTEYANHHLFKVLLDDAESEFGFTSDGPLVLPCDVFVFQQILAAVDDERRRGYEEEDGGGRRGFARGRSGYGFFSACIIGFGSTDQLCKKLNYEKL